MEGAGAAEQREGVAVFIGRCQRQLGLADALGVHAGGGGRAQMLHGARRVRVDLLFSHKARRGQPRARVQHDLAIHKPPIAPITRHIGWEGGEMPALDERQSLPGRELAHSDHPAIALTDLKVLLTHHLALDSSVKVMSVTKIVSELLPPKLANRSVLVPPGSVMTWFIEPLSSLATGIWVRTCEPLA